MSTNLKNAPGYNDRTTKVLEALKLGKVREDIAKELGWKNYKCLDMAMRRKGFVWDRHARMYVVPEEQPRKIHPKRINGDSKALRIIDLFRSANADPRSIASRLGFADHRVMAEYMKSRGYTWDANANNYIVEASAPDLFSALMEEESGTSVPPRLETDHAPVGMGSTLSAEPVPSRYTALLRFLDAHMDRLTELLEAPLAGPEAVPHYVIPGDVQPKTVRIKSSLAQLITDFAEERGISQKVIVEAALVNFFRRYGYEDVVDQWVRGK